MPKSRLVKISKYLSYHLRHHPEKLNLELGPGGWVEVEKLLTASRTQKFPFSRQELEEVVRKNDKKRFSFNPEGTLIRANQGHSVKIDLQLEPVPPPQILYHGTVEQIVEAIWRGGLQKMSRHHVHLSRDIATAQKVGQRRRGRTVIFQVNADKMQEKGYQFFRSDNDVWLVDHVPPEYLQIVSQF